METRKKNEKGHWPENGDLRVYRLQWKRHTAGNTKFENNNKVEEKKVEK